MFLVKILLGVVTSAFMGILFLVAFSNLGEQMGGAWPLLDAVLSLVPASFYQ